MPRLPAIVGVIITLSLCVGLAALRYPQVNARIWEMVQAGRRGDPESSRVLHFGVALPEGTPPVAAEGGPPSQDPPQTAVAKIQATDPQARDADPWLSVPVAGYVGDDTVHSEGPPVSRTEPQEHGEGSGERAPALQLAINIPAEAVTAAPQNAPSLALLASTHSTVAGDRDSALPFAGTNDRLVANSAANSNRLSADSDRLAANGDRTLAVLRSGDEQPNLPSLVNYPDGQTTVRGDKPSEKCSSPAMVAVSWGKNSAMECESSQSGAAHQAGETVRQPRPAVEATSSDIASASATETAIASLAIADGTGDGPPPLVAIDTSKLRHTERSFSPEADGGGSSTQGGGSSSGQAGYQTVTPHGPVARRAPPPRVSIDSDLPLMSIGRSPWLSRERPQRLPPVEQESSGSGALRVSPSFDWSPAIPLYPSTGR